MPITGDPCQQVYAGNHARTASTTKHGLSVLTDRPCNFKTVGSNSFDRILAEFVGPTTGSLRFTPDNNRGHPVGKHAAMKCIHDLFTRDSHHLVIEGIQVIQREPVIRDHGYMRPNI